MCNCEKKIKVTPCGPYEVSGNVPLKQEIISCDGNGESKEWKEGKTYKPACTPYHLCRCGRSSEKPFCDGAHASVNFVGRETAPDKPYKQSAKVYKGPVLNLMDDFDLCAVSRFCDRGEGVWELIKKEDEDSLAQAVQEACDCPSGRLTVTDCKGKMVEPSLNQEIGVIEDPVKGFRGPLWVKGGIKIEGADGKVYEVRNRVTLCRCGQSKNLPFCDTSHLKCEHMKGQDN